MLFVCQFVCVFVCFYKNNRFVLSAIWGGSKLAMGSIMSCKFRPQSEDLGPLCPTPLWLLQKTSQTKTIALCLCILSFGQAAIKHWDSHFGPPHSCPYGSENTLIAANDITSNTRKYLNFYIVLNKIKCFTVLKFQPSKIFVIL